MKILKATYHLFFFKTYTDLPRWIEVLSGIAAWISVANVVCGLILYLR